MKSIPRHFLTTFFAAITFAVLGVFTLNAQASSVFFLHIDGIDGESTNKAHAGWIEIQSFSWGLSNSLGGGGGGGGGASKPTFSPFAWTQGIDKSVVPLFMGVASGKHFKNATLDAVRQNGSGLASTYFQMKFDDVLLTKMDMSGTDSAITVNAAFEDYSRVTMTYKPQLPDGRLGPAITGGWDLSGGNTTFFGNPLALEGLILVAPGNPVPVPAAAWLMGSGLLGLAGVARRKAV